MYAQCILKSIKIIRGAAPSAKCIWCLRPSCSARTNMLMWLQVIQIRNRLMTRAWFRPERSIPARCIRRSGKIIPETAPNAE
jgi:hypothetical protein